MYIYYIYYICIHVIYKYMYICIHICVCIYVYIFVIEFSTSYYKLFDIGLGDHTYRVTWLINHMVPWYSIKAKSLPPVGQRSSILVGLQVRVGGAQLPNHMNHLFPFLQGICSQNLGVFWLCFKGPYLLGYGVHYD